MHAFHIQYRNTQGTLMRILNAVSRRALEIHYVQAGPAKTVHSVILTLEVNPKQIGQLCRDWHAIVDVMEIRAAVAPSDLSDPTTGWDTVSRGHSPAGVRGISAAATA